MFKLYKMLIHKLFSDIKIKLHFSMFIFFFSLLFIIYVYEQ